MPQLNGHPDSLPHLPDYRHILPPFYMAGNGTGHGLGFRVHPSSSSTLNRVKPNYILP